MGNFLIMEKKMTGRRNTWDDAVMDGTTLKVEVS